MEEYILTKDYEGKCLLKIAGSDKYLNFKLKQGAILHCNNNVIYSKKNVPMFYKNSKEFEEYTKVKEDE